MNNKNVKIYVISHSEEDIKQIKADDLYTPLFVGRNGRDNLGFLSDDKGDNISAKNSNYCELTGLYWMWKHSKADIIGLCHYRRFFVSNGHNITKEEIENYLTDYDIILPKKLPLIKGSYKETFEETCLLKSLYEIQKIIERDYPEMLDKYIEFLNSSGGYYGNLFITKKELADEFCEWIFPIYQELEDKIDFNKFPRGMGFIGEAIMNFWVGYKEYKIKECNIKHLGNSLNLSLILRTFDPSRKIYQFCYKNFLKKGKGKKVEKYILKILSGKHLQK